MPLTSPEEHLIGDRRFVVISESTVEQDLHFLALIKQAGIDEVIAQPGETAEAFARRLLEVTVASDKTLDLLGCLLVPTDSIPPGTDAGDAWTREIAEETASFLGHLKSKADKAKLRSLILSLLLCFFDNGIVCLWSSRTSPQGPIPPIEMNNPTAGDMDAGNHSSSRSQTAITIKPNESSDGRFVSPSSATGGE